MVRRHYDLILYSVGLIVIASLIYVLGTSLVFFSSSDNLQLSYLISLICFMPLGFIILPHYISKRGGLYSDNKDVTFNWKSYLVVAVIIFLINYFFLGSTEYFKQMIISMSEEFLFRFVIYKILRKNYSYIQAIVIGSLLFGVVLHLNYPLMDNLLVRAPLGLLFYILATKFGLQYAVAGHWIFNLYQSVLG
ncbi:CPBP family intramembrane glutamic endopeptidase [Streptococcus lutetiensis]|uniref:CPBP family intramembrane glutamic endopeptidase n=1 Tax=Streptococcus lutetiensis TaxID=150055 RepID=UPI001962BA36|nr:CPBP family intramembrane glutamic endopeptidase [Streptococcus lutetiensis]